MRRLCLSAALILAVVVVTPQAAVASEVSCVVAVQSQAPTASASLVERVCAIWEQRYPAAKGSNQEDSTEVPTFTMAWVAVSDPLEAGPGTNWVISAGCVITGIVTSATTAFYVLASEAHTFGPAITTRSACTATPSGLSIDQTTPGAASAGYDVSPDLFTSQLRPQRVCPFGSANYLVAKFYRETKLLPGCSPPPIVVGG